MLAVMFSFTPQARQLEALLPALGSYFMAPAQPAPGVAVVAIDQASLDQHGRWPWPRARIAALLERLQALQPAVIGLMLPLANSENPAALASLRAELASLDPPLRRQAAAWLAQLDADRQLARAIARAGNVIVGAGTASEAAHAVPSRRLARFALASPDQGPSWEHFLLQGLLSPPRPAATALLTPLPLLLDAAAGLAVSHGYRDQQRVLGAPLVVRVADRHLPGLELALLAAVRGIDRSELSYAPGMPLHIGTASEPRADTWHYPRPAPAPPQYSARDLLLGDSLADGLRGKAVLVGLSAPDLAARLNGPRGQVYTPVGWSAQVLASLLADDGLSIPGWGYAAQRGLLLLFALYLIVLPVSWQRLRAPLVSTLTAAALLNGALLILVVRGTWLPVVTPLLFLLGVQLLLMLAGRGTLAVAALHQQAIQARLELGRNLQSQGQLDPAMQQFMSCLPAAAALEALYELALEYERKRQVSRARTIYASLETTARGFRDAARRHAQLTSLGERFPNASGAGASRTLILDNPVLELPVLGRYRLQRELGSGAMGTVYLAVDPNIGREVAIKALPLQENPADAKQDQVAARFFHEAEAVGRLDHPNIVTLHDVGREHDLAYMAMDYVAGESLDAWTHPSTLLPVWEVLEIAAQVADGLDYAHGRQVVHRDIKPSNIIYDRSSGLAKITDFGVARMLDSNRTRTGTVLGSPSYMSPEQVAGKRVDGRSDLFSLGITLYQLLSGRLPFSGDSVANVMYQIANASPPPLRKARRGLPVAATRLVMRALQKEPARRFASGGQMAEAIRKCRAQLRGGRRKTA